MKIKEFNFEKILFFLIFLIIAIICFNFLDYNLMNHDHYAHFDSSKNIMENWPNPVFWEEQYFNGYPQNYFYPPLFSFITATLGLITGLDFAFKFIMFFLLIGILFLFYKLSWIFEKKETMHLYLLFLIAFFLNGFIYFLNELVIGSNAVSIFEYGFLPNGLAMLLTLLFIHNFELDKNWKGLGLIFGLAILSHYISLILIVYIIVKYYFDKNIDYLKILFSGLIISAFWWIPFLLNKEFISSTFGIMPLLLTPISIFIILITLILILDKKNSKTKQFAITGSILYIFVLITWLISINLQLHRILFFSIIFITPYFFEKLKSILNKKQKFILLISLFLIFIFLSSTIETESSTKVIINNDFKCYGDYLVLGHNNKMVHHALFHTIVEKNCNVLKGLYLEQSPNTPLITGFARKIQYNELYWGAETINPEMIDNNVETLRNIFGTDAIISPENLDINYLEKKKIGEQWIKTNQTKLLWFETGYTWEKIDIFEYKLEKIPKIEVLNYIPKNFMETNWKIFSNIYLTKFSKIVTKNEIKNANINPNAKIINYKRENDQKISFFIDSNVNAPIYIKESYFPNWKAYENGKEIEVYLATPYQMLIVGKGEIELKYEKSLIENILYFISIGFGIVILLLLFRKKFKI